MAAVVARQRAQSALNFLPQKTTWMEPFHAANFKLILVEYCDYLDRDDVLTHVLAGLRRHLTRTGKDWADEAVRRGAPSDLPQDPIAAFALRWDLMRTVRMDKIDLRYFVSSFYPGSHLNEKLMHWKRLVVHPFARDLRALAALLLERLPADEWVDLVPLFESTLEELRSQAFGPRAWNDADDAAAEAAEAAERSGRATAPRRAPATPGASKDAGGPTPGASKDAGGATAGAQPRADSPSAAPPAAAAEPDRPAHDLASALDALARAVEGARDLSPDERHDLLLEARILALEGKKRASAGRDRLGARLDAFAVHGPLARAVAEARRHLESGP